MSFIGINSNEPPPLDLDSDDENDNCDYEFHSKGLQLDVTDEPSPQASPNKHLQEGSMTSNSALIVEEKKIVEENVLIENQTLLETQLSFNLNLTFSSYDENFKNSQKDINQDIDIEDKTFIDVDTIQKNKDTSNDFDTALNLNNSSSFDKLQTNESEDIAFDEKIVLDLDDKIGITKLESENDCSYNESFATFDDSDFGDFESSEISIDMKTGNDLENQPKHSVPVINFDLVVKSIFSNDLSLGTREIVSIDKVLSTNVNKLWSHVKEFEDSHCLLFKWSKCQVNQLLLKSLNIDTSLIIYSAKFGTIEVPKYAISLVDAPLLPTSSNMLGSRLNKSELETDAFDFVSESEFGSIDINPGSSKSVISSSNVIKNSDKEISKEAVRILEQLPDLSYIRAKTLMFPRNPKYSEGG